MNESSSTLSPVAGPRFGLALAAALHALVFTAAALVLPSQQASWLSISAAPLALLSAALSGLALTRRARALAWVWTALALYALLWLAGISWVVGSSALYLSELYRGMGQAIAAGLACLWAVAVLFTVPLALWGLALTQPRWLRRRPMVVSVALLVTIGLVSACSMRNLAKATPVAGDVSLDEVSHALGNVARDYAGSSEVRARASVAQLLPVTCSQPIRDARLTLLVSALAKNGEPLSSCLQGSSPERLAQALRDLLHARAAPDAAYKLDLVRSMRPVPQLHPLLDSLALRPGVDGACSRGRCLAPWQLVGIDAFTSNHPLDSVKDASFGVSLSAIAQALGGSTADPLDRIETASWLAERQAMRPLLRGRPPEVPLSSIDGAVASAGRHIIAAQRPDGTFRYVLDPYTGQTDERLASLRRQAGTTFALCELLPRDQVAASAARALALLRGLEHQHGPLSMLSDQPNVAEIGPTALPLIAFAACHEAVGHQYDVLMGRMASFLLALQRENGAFHPEMDIASGEPRGEYESLYAGGQVVLALVLVEQLARKEPGAHWPQAEALHRGIERAMNYYANDYWPRPLRSLLFLEENWHCLAARAALDSHRNDDYERFCLDYARFKRRFILDAEPGVSPEHVGGYSISDMFPPHAAVTAGYGELLSAAIEIERARGMDVRADQATLRAVLGFLLRQQWTADICFACARGEAVGGFSESASSPKIRIDYVQHAMAALSHGQRALR